MFNFTLYVHKRRGMILRVPVILTIALLWLCQAAVWSAAEARPNADGETFGQVRHDAAALVPAGQGDVIVLWRAVTSDGASVYAQKLDSRGKELWKAGGVEVCRQSVADFHFSAATDGHGGVIAAWEDYREGRYNPNIYAQRLDRDGKPLWRKDGAPVCTAEYQQLNPMVVVDQHGGAYVFWTDYRNGNADIFGSHLSPKGEVVHRFAVCTKSEDQTDVVATAAPSGGACIVWVDHRYDNPGIYAQIVSANDKLMWKKNGLPVCTGDYQQDAPSAIALPGGNFLITWVDYRDRLARVFLQLVSAGGNKISPSNGTAVKKAWGPQYGPSLCLTGHSDAAVTWLQYGKGAGMFQQQLSVSGAIKLRPEVSISRPSLGQFRPNSVPDGTGGVVTVWLAYAGDNVEVFGQRTGPENLLKWGSGGIMLGHAAGIAHPRILGEQMGHLFVAAWTSASGSSSKIAVVGLSENGKITWRLEI